MSKLIVLAWIAVPAVALADTCPVTKGTVPMFSVQERPKHDGGKTPRMPERSMELFLFDNGAWNVATEAPKQAARGCLPAPKVAAVKAALARATWKTTSTGNPCDAVATHTTSYVVNNKVVLRRELCDALTVDKATEKALDEVMQTLRPLIAAAK